LIAVEFFTAKQGTDLTMLAGIRFLNDTKLIFRCKSTPGTLLQLRIRGDLWIGNRSFKGGCSSPEYLTNLKPSFIERHERCQHSVPGMTKTIGNSL
jgi:hypothetical protein